MRFYWICDRIYQKQFNVYWQKEDSQKWYFHSKHQPTSHHSTVRPTYLHAPQRQHSSHLQGYVNLDLCALDVRAINTGVQGVHIQIKQYSRFVYSRCKVQTTGHPIFHKYSRYNNNNKGGLCKIPKKNDFNKNSLI